jgi:single-stranded-DNA-specific exonuclease
VEAARLAGIDVIVTDHHDLPLNLPAALAVINPKRPDCGGVFKGLSGAGVAFYLLICLRKYLRDRNFWQGRAEPNLKQLTDLVALGTVADVVPLVQANRYLVKTGLDVINAGARPGIKALAALCGAGGAPIDADDIAFRLGPRLNAAGRMDHARIAFDLLTDRDPASARDRARSLDALNAQRQTTERELMAGIEAHLAQHPQLLTREAIVLARADWHEGVLGIVASRLVEKHFRPVVLIALRDGIGKGSARSVPGFDLHGALTTCAADLVDFGGHAMAAGLKLKADRLEEFREKFVQAVARGRDPDGRVAQIQIDAELALDDISDRLIDELEGLQPFGNGNPEPLFRASDIEILSSGIVGTNHRRMRVRQSAGHAGKTFQAIHFRVDPQRPPPETPLAHMLFRLRWNRWKDQKRPQLIVEDIGDPAAPT